MIRLLAFTVSVLLLAATSHAQERPPIFQQMFKAYGFESFGQVEKIRYTFNLEFPGLNFSRSWEWEPKTDLISYEGKDKDGKPVKVTYARSQLGSQSDVVKNEIDPAFRQCDYASGDTGGLIHLMDFANECITGDCNNGSDRKSPKSSTMIAAVLSDPLNSK